ncbi:hypothetical protein HU830_08500 [Lactobacillus sp. DCY120]|uniref:Uncharacterized protein n=1 Tax=Bombilactobacillus apium TaxID=2675299 RepID=A0A850R202_9LACO|nr:hypothetical protein [Bombilactobacillus apium]NVY97159.1 hypothetical protein [Bombilactobacillus apium]
MQLTVQQFQEKIANHDYQQQQKEFPVPSKITAQTLTPVAQALVQGLEDDLDRGYLSEVEALMTGLPFTCSFLLQTGIINLPLADSAKTRHFFTPEETVTVTANLVTICPNLNASDLRIDQVVGDATSIAEATTTIATMMAQNLEQAQVNYAAQAQEVLDAD